MTHPPATRSEEFRKSDNSRRALMTLPEVAQFLHVSPKTIRRLIAHRGLPHVRFGRVVRFLEDDILRWVEARREV